MSFFSNVRNLFIFFIDILNTFHRFFGVCFFANVCNLCSKSDSVIQPAVASFNAFLILFSKTVKLPLDCRVGQTPPAECRGKVNFEGGSCQIFRLFADAEFSADPSHFSVFLSADNTDCGQNRGRQNILEPMSAILIRRVVEKSSETLPSFTFKHSTNQSQSKEM